MAILGIAVTLDQYREPLATTGRILAWGGAHALAGHLFSLIHPLAGGLHGVVFGLSQNAFHWAWDKYMPVRNRWTEMAKWALGYFSSLALGAAVTNLVGVPLTLKTVAIFHLSTLGVIAGMVSAAAIVLTLVVATVCAVAFCLIIIRMYAGGLTMDQAYQEALGYVDQTLDFVGIVPANLPTLWEFSGVAAALIAYAFAPAYLIGLEIAQLGLKIAQWVYRTPPAQIQDPIAIAIQNAQVINVADYNNAIYDAQLAPQANYNAAL